MNTCPICQHSSLTVTTYLCNDCALIIQGHFTLPRLARLPAASQKLAEHLILCGGNLKQMTEKLNISYPTLRKQVDSLILQLHELQQHDQQRIEEIMDEMERGAMKAEQGIRLIKEINGEL